MTQDTWLTETYFDWLAQECFRDMNERKTYEGVLRVLHDIPFYWTIWLDENRSGDALDFRKNGFLGFQRDLDRLDQHWLHNWAEATPTVLEVLLGIARRWTFHFEGEPAFYFAHLFKNMRFDRYPGRQLTSQGQHNVRILCDDWMARQFQPNGIGSPFPVSGFSEVDFRRLDIWAQMNAYSSEHFQ